MNLSSIIRNRAAQKIILTILILFVVIFVILTLTQDLLRARLNGAAFYLSEAFLFSSFWWFFVPLCYAQYLAIKQKFFNKIGFKVLVIIVPIVLHLIAFPTLVWAISSLFFDHTYAILRTLTYTLSEEMYKLLLGYTIPVITYQLINVRLKTKAAELENNDHPTYSKSILVTIGNKKINIVINDIFYLSAETPYINIHLNEKSYLHAETLKALSEKMNPAQFVRIHKSMIVNILYVKSYTSRLNGDYDLTLINDIKLRVSRKFAPDFKKRFLRSSS